MTEDILSFVIGSPDIDPQYIDAPEDIEPGSMWDNLLKAITKVVKGDGIKKGSILPGQSTASVTKNAAENIYYDVSEFYYWYFVPEDQRSEFVRSQKQATILSPLRSAVKPVVEFNLDDMREAELIPADQDNENLVNRVTDDLTRYILNWQDWYYDRKEDEELEEHFINKAMYKEIYVDSDYGNLINLDNYLDPDVDDLNGYGNMPYQNQEEDYPS